MNGDINWINLLLDFQTPVGASNGRGLNIGHPLTYNFEWRGVSTLNSGPYNSWNYFVFFFCVTLLYVLLVCGECKIWARNRCN